MTNEEKQKHIDALKYWCETNEECGVITIPKFVCDNIIEILDNAPTIEERPKGKWKYTCTLPIIRKCSICGVEQNGEVTIYDNFCPNCGADMRGDV